jgi:hypothetical protein
MAYLKKRTLSNSFSLTNKNIDLPRDAVIDKIFLKCTVKMSNASTTADFNGTNADFLKKISTIRVFSNGSNVHYSLTGLDLAVVNYMDHEGITINPDGAIKVEKQDDLTVSFVLVLDEGDILACLKDSLTFNVEVNPAVATNVTISEFSGVVTLEENVMTAAEFTAIYGAAAENAAEPKVTVIEKGYNVSGELTEFVDLPTGTLLRRSIFINSDANGVKGNADPSKMGIIRSTPDRSEIFTCDVPTLKEINKMDFRVGTGIGGVFVVDYGREITNDEFGLRGWKFVKGDYQVAYKSAAAGKLRMINVEYVINTAQFDAVQTAMREYTN